MAWAEYSAKFTLRNIPETNFATEDAFRGYLEEMQQAEQRLVGLLNRTRIVVKQSAQPFPWMAPVHMITGYTNRGAYVLGAHSNGRSLKSNIGILWRARYDIVVGSSDADFTEAVKNIFEPETPNAIKTSPSPAIRVSRQIDLLTKKQLLQVNYEPKELVEELMVTPEFAGTQIGLN